MHRRVNILQYVRTPFGRWQWEPIPKNRRTGSYVWSKAKSNHFYIVWREEKRRHYQKAGSTPSDALEAKRRKEFELAGRAVLQDGKQIPKPQDGSFTIEAAVADFLEFTKNKKRPNTYKRYRAVLNHFRAFAKPYTQVGAITPADIDAYRDERLAEKNARGKPISPRGVNYEVATIRSFYYYLQKFRDPSLSNPAARLKPLAVTKTVVDTYDEAELEKFFQACTKEEQAIFKTFYYTGLREQELAHLHWSDLNLVKGILVVRAKPEEGFIPKDWEEREIPLHPRLVTALKELPRRHAKLVFSTLKGNPNGHLLRMLKQIVERAKLRDRWYLHKFRKTFATRALEKGGDIRTVQALLGHKNITTTARYLSTSTDKMREAVTRL
jgi:integrase